MMKQVREESNLLSEVPLLLLRYAAFFRMYNSYAQRYNEGLKLLRELRNSNEDFDIFLKVSERVCNTAVNSLLITPIQRSMISFCVGLMF